MPFIPSLAEKFRDRYLASLSDYRAFYDDMDSYGKLNGKSQVFYFVPGINGTPGQIRFAIPSLLRMYGSEIYIQCLSVKEFSSRTAIWDKYTIPNVDLRVSQIRSDIMELSEKTDGITVIANSNGFYDFAKAQSQLPAEVRAKITLLWVSFAPDYFKVSRWVEVFRQLNGFEMNGFSWVAVPNHNLLSGINPEARLTQIWSERFGRVNDKRDLEARFQAGGAWWAYTSPDCFNAMLKHLTEGVEIVEIPTFVLIAQHDGYWYGRPNSAKEATLKRYLRNYTTLERSTSHLWVAQPPHLEEFVRLIQHSTDLAKERGSSKR